MVSALLAMAAANFPLRVAVTRPGRNQMIHYLSLESFGLNYHFDVLASLREWSLPLNAARLMTPTANDRGGSLCAKPAVRRVFLWISLGVISYSGGELPLASPSRRRNDPALSDA
jgi:hypothetical protein